MGNYPTRVDGIGSRKSGADSSTFSSLGILTANKTEPSKFVRLYATEAIAKGDAVAYDFSATEPTNGWGSHIMIADSANLTNMHVIGIAAEAIAITDIGLVQVYGKCSFAKVNGAASVSDSNIGQLLCVSDQAGELELILGGGAAVGAGGGTFGVAHLLDFVTDGAADSVVFLINPMNL